MEAKVPIIVVQFQKDFFCNPKQYPNWYSRIIAHAEARRTEPSFLFLNLPGTHSDAEKLATHSRLEDYAPELRVVWHTFWTAVTGD